MVCWCFVQHSQHMHRLVDVDILVDTTDIYGSRPTAGDEDGSDSDADVGGMAQDDVDQAGDEATGGDGWARALARAEKEMVARGTHTTQLAVGTSHTVALSEEGQLYVKPPLCAAVAVWQCVAGAGFLH